MRHFVVGQLWAKFASINAIACRIERYCTSGLPAVGSLASICEATAINSAFARCSKYARPLGQPCSVSCIYSWQSRWTRRVMTKRGGGMR